MRLFLGVLFLLILIPFTEAQQLKNVPLSFLNYSNQPTKLNIFENIPANKEINLNLVKTEEAKYPELYNNISCQQTLPKGAIFCRMEDALHAHLNFWVKFRMGTDDRYSN
jgi:hypothetical protein